LIFGYTYPELIDWNTTAAELASSVRTKINLLYNPNAADKKNSQTATGKPLVKAVDTNRAFDNITIHDAKKLGMNNLDMQWNIDIRVQRYTYNTSFSIDVPNSIQPHRKPRPIHRLQHLHDVPHRPTTRLGPRPRLAVAYARC
jgi:hypothetical protein